MLHRKPDKHNKKAITIDISNINLNDDVIICSGPNGLHYIPNPDQGLEIRLPDTYENYELIFGNSNLPLQKITIDGSTNDLIIKDSNVVCNELKIIASTVTTTDDCAIQCKYVDLKIDKATLYGEMITEKMFARIGDGQCGLTNLGNLNISYGYAQENGYFINKGDFLCYGFLLKHVSVAANYGHMQITEKAAVKSDSFINLGNLYIK
jgi:hypothetical protein